MGRRAFLGGGGRYYLSVGSALLYVILLNIYLNFSNKIERIAKKSNFSPLNYIKN